MNEFDKIIGYEDIKKELLMTCDALKNPEKYASLGITTPKGLLMHGEPGVGKTLMAQCLISESGRKAFVCKKNRPDGDFVNEIRKTFDDAVKNKPSIVFLDDMDKFANEDEFHPNCEEYITIQSCIDEIKNEEVFVLATANDVRNLPNSLLRAGRFDKVIPVKCPTGNDAIEIVKHYLSTKKNVKSVDAQEVARILDGRSCAELECVINQAGIYAAYNNKNFIEMQDIVDACLRIIFKAPKSSQAMDLQTRKMTAYHEAGHAVAHEILEPGCVNLISILSSSGDICGVTSYRQDDNYWNEKELMEKRVIEILAGKAATEIVFGKVDAGANNDLHRAFVIVERFVDDFCSYGFNCFEFNRNSSNELLNRKETLIFNELEKYYQKSKQLLIENRTFLDNIAQSLLENTTILAQDIQQIKLKSQNV